MVRRGEGDGETSTTNSTFGKEGEEAAGGEYTCQVCGKDVALSRLVRCPGCQALYFCSNRHMKACLHQLGHQPDECERMKAQLARARDLQQIHKCFDQDVFWQASPWTARYSRGELKLTELLGGCLLGRDTTGVGTEQEQLELQISRREDGHELVTRFSIAGCVSRTDSDQQELAKANTAPWENFYKNRGIPMRSPAALVLHTPFTLMHFCQTQWEPQEKKKKNRSSSGADFICIHVLGADEEFAFCSVFAELAQCFPNKRVKVFFVGPNVPNQREAICARRTHHHQHHQLKQQQDGNWTLRYSLLFGDDCSTATSMTRTELVQVFALRGFYHEVDLNEIGGKPDIIFAQNAGLAAYPSWVPTVQVILGLNRTDKVPFFCSDYCEEAALRGMQMLRGLGADSNRLIPVQTNTFLQPLRRVNTDNALPSYSNGFLYGLSS